MRRLTYAAAVAALIALVTWAFLPARITVETASVTRGTLTVHVDAEGEARIREVVIVSAPISGLLQRVTLHAGDAVAAGQTVAMIGAARPALLDSRARAVAEAAAAAAAAAVELARSQLVQAEAALEYAGTEADRARALFARASLSQRLLDDALLAERTAKAAVVSAKANLSVREKERQSADAILDGGAASDPAGQVDLRAPVAGSILRVVTEDEQVVQAGTPILEIGNLLDLEIVVHVLSRDAVGIAEGAEAIVTGWGGPDLPARVERVEPSATTQVSALGIEEQRVEVRLALHDAPPPDLGHGFRVTVRIWVQEANDVLKIPVPALFRQGGDWAIYAVEDGRAMLRTVTLGMRNDEEAMAMSGVSDGTVVILHPDDSIRNGVRIAP